MISVKATAMLFLALILGLLFTGALGVPLVNEAGPGEINIWGPTARFFWRCQSPFLVEVSDDLQTWIPSSICLEGTCCSSLSTGPLCSKAACDLVSKEKGLKKGQDALGATAGLSPKRPSLSG